MVLFLNKKKLQEQKHIVNKTYQGKYDYSGMPLLKEDYKYGFDSLVELGGIKPETAYMLGKVESNFKPDDKGLDPRDKGLFQLNQEKSIDKLVRERRDYNPETDEYSPMPSIWKELSSKYLSEEQEFDPFIPVHNSIGAGWHISETKKTISNKLGRPATDEDVLFAYKTGATGYVRDIKRGIASDGLKTRYRHLIQQGYTPSFIIDKNGKIIKKDNKLSLLERITPTAEASEITSDTNKKSLWDIFFKKPKMVFPIGEGLSKEEAEKARAVVTKEDLAVKGYREGSFFTRPTAGFYDPMAHGYLKDIEFAQQTFFSPRSTREEKNEAFDFLMQPVMSASQPLQPTYGKIPIKNIKGNIKESVLKIFAKDTKPASIERSLKQMGLDDMNAKSLSESLAKTKTVNEVKEVLGSYKPVFERIPLGEIIKKEPTYYHGTNNGKEIVEQGFNLSKLGDNSGYKGIMGNGIYLDMTPNAEGARLYGKDILEVKPKSGLKLFEWSGKVSDLYHEKTGYGTPEKITEYLQSQGYDGVKLNNQQMVIFNPKNIEKVKISGQGTGELSQIKQPRVEPIEESPIDINFQTKIKNKQYLKKNFEDENVKIEDSGERYVYHATNSKNIENIKKEGLIPQKTDVISEQKGNYFALGPEAIHSVVGKNANSILRLKVNSYDYSHKNNIPKLDEEAYGDSIVFPKKISADDLEILTEDGWKPLVKKEPIKPVKKEITSAIVEEAKKYPTKEEFVKAQTKTYQELKKSGADIPEWKKDSLFELKTKSIDDIYYSNFDRNYENTKELMNSIKRGDKMKPIIIDNAGTILDGNHRYDAYKRLGIKNIEVFEEVKESKYLYHGTPIEIKNGLLKMPSGVEYGGSGYPGIFTSKDINYSKTYGDKIYKIDTTGLNIAKENSKIANQIIDEFDKASDLGQDLSIISKKYADKGIDAVEMADGTVFLRDIQAFKDISEIKPKEPLLPTVIQGETFTMGPSTTTTATVKTAKTELKATQKEIKNAQIAAEKAAKLEAKEQKVREDAIANLQRFRGNVENIKADLQKRNLSEEDLDNIILEDGTKLNEAIKVKRNSDGTLSDVITQKEIDDLKASYTDEIPKNKWQKRNVLVDGKEVATTAIQSLELPYAYFERKGLSSIYDQVIKAGRDSEIIKNRFIQKFKDQGLFKDGGWFTADRFNIDKKESKSIADYYLGRQGKAKQIELSSLSENAQKFIKVFDEIINETTEPFYQMASKMGKQPGVVENYAPLMTAEDIKLIDQGGSQDWLFRKHPAFSALKERVKKAPVEIYEKDYRKVVTRWLDGMSQFLGMSDTTNHLKYLIGSDEFQNIIKDSDQAIISKWLQDITTPKTPDTLIKKTFTPLSQLLRKGVAMGSLGLNYATVLKQALTQIPIMIIEKSTPKMSSEYAKAFGIDVKQLPSISKRKGDIAIQDLQGKISRIFTGPITQFDKLNAQIALNGFLDKEYNKYLKEGVEITEETRKLIEKIAQDKIDMWFAGFFKGQRPEAYREEIGNFILMFTYPLTSQTNGFFRHILKAKGFTGNIKAVAEVLASIVAIAYMENVIENLSPQWSDEQKMTEDILLSLSGNIPLAGNIAYSIATEQDINLSPVIGNVNNIVRAISKGDGEKIMWTISETAGLPKQIRRVNEGLQIMEDGGITDNNGKMLAPVEGAMEYIRAFLRGKYGPLASQDYIRNVGAKKEDKRWFYPEVEFLQTGNYERKAEIYKSWDKEKKKEFYDMLSEGQQKKLDNAIKGITPKSEGKKSLSDIFK